MNITRLKIIQPLIDYLREQTPLVLGRALTADAIKALERAFPLKVPKQIHSDALALYSPPFRFEHGYIFDSNHQVVSDDGDRGDSVARVRGWGRISYLKNPEALQDQVGHIIAEALTRYWEEHR